MKNYRINNNNINININNNKRRTIVHNLDKYVRKLSLPPEEFIKHKQQLQQRQYSMTFNHNNNNEKINMNIYKYVNKDNKENNNNKIKRKFNWKSFIPFIKHNSGNGSGSDEVSRMFRCKE